MPAVKGRRRSQRCLVASPHLPRRKDEGTGGQARRALARPDVPRTSNPRLYANGPTSARYCSPRSGRSGSMAAAIGSKVTMSLWFGAIHRPWSLGNGRPYRDHLTLSAPSFGTATSAIRPDRAGPCATIRTGTAPTSSPGTWSASACAHCQSWSSHQPCAGGGRASWMSSTRRKKSGRRADGDCTCGDDLAALGHDLRRSIHQANLIRVANHTSRPSAPFRTLRRETSKAGDLALGPGSVTGYRWVPGLEHRPGLPKRPAPEEGALILQYTVPRSLLTVIIYDRSIDGAEIAQGLIAARARLFPVGIDEFARPLGEGRRRGQPPHPAIDTPRRRVSSSGRRSRHDIG